MTFKKTRSSFSRSKWARSWFYLLTYILNCVTSIMTLDPCTSKLHERATHRPDGPT